ncbi:hypothetical protein ACWDA3_38975 [Nonomuraea rubra]
MRLHLERERMTGAAERARTALAIAGARLRRTIRGPSRGTTHATLLKLLTGLLSVTALSCVTGLLVFPSRLGVAEAARRSTAPAIVEIVTARAALVRADQAAILSLSSGAELVGAGQEYRNEIAVAGQSLTRAAGFNAVGTKGAGRLQFITGLLVTYEGLIEEADAHFRQEDGRRLGAVHLWSASRLLHDGGLLALIDTLLREHEKKLDEQLGHGAMTPVAVAALTAPVVLLAGLLVVTHRFFRRRFRRRTNPWLLLAAGLLGVLAWSSAHLVASQQEYAPMGDTLRGLIHTAPEQTVRSHHKGQLALRDLLGQTLCVGAGPCGHTVRQYIERAGKLTCPQPCSDPIQPMGPVRTTVQEAGDEDAGPPLLVYALGGLIAGAVFLGFRDRLNEYKYRRK